MKIKIEQKNIETKCIQLEECYRQWRNLNRDNKKEKVELLGKIDEIIDLLEESAPVFVTQIQIRIAYSVPTEEYHIAEKYFLKVVEKEEFFANQTDILETVYQGLGDLYFETKQYDKASDIYIKLLKINELADFIEEDILQMGIAMVNYSNDKYLAKAEDLLSLVYNLDGSHVEMDHLLATKANYQLGLVKYKLRKYQEAKPYLEKALVLFKQRKWDCQIINQLLNSITDAIDIEPKSANNP